MSSRPGIEWVWLLADPLGCPQGSPEQNPPRQDCCRIGRPTVGPPGAFTYEGWLAWALQTEVVPKVGQHRHQRAPVRPCRPGVLPSPTEDGGVSLPRLSQPGRRRRAHGAAGGLLDVSSARRQEERRGEEGLAHHQKHTQVHLPVSPGQQAAQQRRGRGHAHHVHDRGHQGEEQEG